MAWIWISRFICFMLGIIAGMIITIKHYEDKKE